MNALFSLLFCFLFAHFFFRFFSTHLFVHHKAINQSQLFYDVVRGVPPDIRSRFRWLELNFDSGPVPVEILISVTQNIRFRKPELPAAF
jgi:fatty acid desaturase